MTRKLLLTGGSGGIGSAIKKKFIESGWSVEAPTRQELDLSKEESVDDWIKHKCKTYNSVILSAGINEVANISQLNQESFHRHAQINLQSNVSILNHILKEQKRETTLKIVVISSSYSERSRAGRSQYSVSKAGLEAFARSVALEYADQKVLANIIRPGFVSTPLTFRNNEPDQVEKMIEQIPMRRLAEPEEIAEAAFFLASDTNSYITGSVLHVDGGYGVT